MNLATELGKFEHFSLVFCDSRYSIYRFVPFAFPVEFCCEYGTKT
jgi:hypothetical protein